MAAATLEDPGSSTQALINHSLELAGERCGDITPLVFERLFALYPDMESLFFRDRNGAIKGQMLHQAINCFLDMGEGDFFGGNLVRTEMIHHRDDLEVPPEVFRTFFAVVIATLRDLLGIGLTEAVEQAWTLTLHKMDEVARQVQASA